MLRRSPSTASMRPAAAGPAASGGGGPGRSGVLDRSTPPPSDSVLAARLPRRSDSDVGPGTSGSSWGGGSSVSNGSGSGRDLKAAFAFAAEAGPAVGGPPCPLGACGPAPDWGERPPPEPVTEPATFDVTLAPGASLAAALRAAKPGARVLLGPGVYREPATLSIEKEVHIWGRGEATIEAAKIGQEAVKITAAAAIVTLSGVACVATGANAHALWIRGGAVRMHGCRLQARSLACLAVTHTADVTLTDCKMHGSEANGAYVYAGGRAFLHRCELDGCRQANLRADAGGAVLIQHSQVHGSGEDGVYVGEGGHAHVIACHISANQMAGVSIKCAAKGHALVAGCRIAGSLGSGVAISTAVGSARVEQNEIAKSKCAGIAVGKAAAAVDLVGNEVRDGGDCGVYFCGQFTGGRARGNAVFGNKASGFHTIEGASPLLEGNRCYDNGEHGVLAESRARLRMIGNAITQNKWDGVCIDRGGGLAELRGCSISGNGRHGVTIGLEADEGPAADADNAVEGNAQGQVVRLRCPA